MQITAKWIFEDLVIETVTDFARTALPDSVLAQGLDGDGSLELYYEVAAAEPERRPARAFHVDVFLEMVDPDQPDAEVMFDVQDEMDGARVTCVEAVRGAFDGPGETMEWSREKRMWVPLPEEGA